jgi:hypothetical protein
MEDAALSNEIVDCWTVSLEALGRKFRVRVEGRTPDLTVDGGGRVGSCVDEVIASCQSEGLAWHWGRIYPAHGTLRVESREVKSRSWWSVRRS